MKKLFSIFAAISVLVAPVTGVVGCNPAPDLPYIPDNKISENTKKAINKAVLGEITPDSKIKTLFAYNLDEWLKPNFIPVENIMSINIERKNYYEQMKQNVFRLEEIKNEENLPKKSLAYIQKSLLSYRDLIHSPWHTVVEKYNSYLTDNGKNKTVHDLAVLVKYFDGEIDGKTDLYNKKRWLYVDQLRTEKAADWFKDAHAWSLNPKSSDYSEDTKFEQGIFYHVLLNAYLDKVRTDYNVELQKIWNKKIAEEISTNAKITLAFTVWDSEKWTKHFVDDRPVVKSNDNLFENLPILPIEQTIGVKLVVSDKYGTVLNYLIGNFVLADLLELH